MRRGCHRRRSHDLLSGSWSVLVYAPATDVHLRGISMDQIRVPSVDATDSPLQAALSDAPCVTLLPTFPLEEYNFRQ